MTTNKAWGAGIGAAIGAGLTAGLSSWLGHPVDPFVATAISGGIAWVVTYFTPKNAPAA